MKHTSPPREHKGQNLWLLPSDYSVVDIETNNCYDGIMEIIEISALRCRDDHPVAEFSTLVRAHQPIDPFVEGLTGINDRMMAEALSPNVALEAFYQFVGQDILMGHNVNYDVNALYDNLARHNALWLTNDFVDVLRLSRKALPDLAHHRQTDLAVYFGIDITGAHRALVDCHLCQQNYLHIKAILSAGEA